MRHDRVQIECRIECSLAASGGRVIGAMPTSTLTNRQLEVLRSVLDLGVKGAAARLRLSHWTVRDHLDEARRRTGSESRDQLIAWCDDHVPGWRERRPAA